MLAEDGARRQPASGRVIADPAAFTCSGSRGRRIGVIAFDGEHSCTSRLRRDRFAAIAIAPEEPTPRSERECWLSLSVPPAKIAGLCNRACEHQSARSAARWSGVAI